MVAGNFHFHAYFKYKLILSDTNLSGVQSSFTHVIYTRQTCTKEISLMTTYLDNTLISENATVL